MWFNIVSEKRNRWFVNLVMALGLIAFLGLGAAPIIKGVVEATADNAQSTPNATQTAQKSEKEQLEATAKGYEMVLQREPENKTALRGLLETRLKLNDLPGSILALEKLVKLEPQETDYAVLLAQAKQQTGDREGSAGTYRQILKSQPGNIKALQGMVNLLQEQKQPETAIGLLQDTLKTAPQTNEIQPGSINIVSVQMILAEVYTNEQRYAEAIAVYDEAIKTDAKDFRPFLGKALILQRQGKGDEATKLFATATELSPARYRDQIKQLASETPTPTPTPTPTATPSP